MFAVGQTVEAPRGGIPVVVLAEFGDGEVIATSSGTLPTGFGCSCQSPSPAYYEYLSGPHQGSHGWFDASPSCRKVYQVG